MDFGFDDILPYLASAYRRGVLTPFLGSGMSRPACASWLDLLRGLAGAAGVEVPDDLKSANPEDRLDTSAMVRLADQAVLGLSALDGEARAAAYRAALGVGGGRESGGAAGGAAIPAQTGALARCYWPLVLTTNYDDLYVVSRIRQSRPAEGARRDETDVPEVLGRTVEDCHKVLRSLDAPTRPVLWALQGFLGGQAAAPERLVDAGVLDDRRRGELLGQVVVGHQQYQHTINAHPHFRRAFAEVFSRRSLLFLGSGILEDYLINLLGEIAHNHGPGPYPHFALFSKDKRATIDARFLQTRLGIAPVFYEHYSDLPELIGRLTDAVGERRAPLAAGVAGAAAGWMPDELGFSLSDGLRGGAGRAKRLRLRYAPLQLPGVGEGDGGACAIVSVGRTGDNRPLQGRQASDALATARAGGLVEDTNPGRWVPLGEAPSYVYRFGGAPIFGVAARGPVAGAPAVVGQDDPEDARDLGVIAEAVVEALRAADAAGFRRAHLGPVASGQYRLWHPLHPFVETLAGIRRFFEGAPGTGIEAVELHVLSPAIWYPVIAGKVPVAEMLSSRMMKIWVDVRDASGGSEIFAVTVAGPTRVGEIKRLCGLPPARWSTEILPRPGRVDPSAEEDLWVTPSAIVVLSPRPEAGPGPGDEVPLRAAGRR